MESNNYVTIQGWMRTELELSGIELIIYAIIYGFSQDGETKFNGAASYLADWCGVSKKTVYNTLSNLVDRGLIVKEETEKNHIKFCTYSVPSFPSRENFSVGRENSSHNNNIYNNNSLLDTNNNRDTIKNIIIYLNNKCDTHYRVTNKKTQTQIKARFKEGFTEADFYKVIDNKVAEWKDNPQMCQYLRPETLFGTKFEGYLNQKAVVTPPKPGIEINPKQREGMNDIVDWGM